MFLGGVYELEGPEVWDGPLAQGRQSATLSPPQNPGASSFPPLQTRPDPGPPFISILLLVSYSMVMTTWSSDSYLNLLGFQW